MFLLGNNSFFFYLEIIVTFSCENKIIFFLFTIKGYKLYLRKISSLCGYLYSRNLTKEVVASVFTCGQSNFHVPMSLPVAK